MTNTVVADFLHSGAMYRDVWKTLNCSIDQQVATASAFLTDRNMVNTDCLMELDWTCFGGLFWLVKGKNRTNERAKVLGGSGISDDTLSNATRIKLKFLH